MTILGISIGTTRTGVCVLKDGVLLDRQIHNYHQAWSDNKLRIILNKYRQYLNQRTVDAIIVKIPRLKSHSKPISTLIKRIERLAREYQCEFDLITKSELKNSLHLTSTKELIAYSTMLFPELFATYKKGRVTEHSYYKKVHEAVLSAYVYQERRKARAKRMVHSS